MINKPDKILENWNINKNEFDELSSLKEQINFCLKYAILAPSTHNSQPWLFKINDNSCEVYINKDKKLPYADPTERDIYISVGCAIQNLVIAAQYFNIFKDIHYDSHNNLVAVINFKNREGGVNKVHQKSIGSILNWNNSRGIFSKKEIHAPVEKLINKINTPEDIDFNLITDKKIIQKLAEFTAEGIKIAYADKNFRYEASNWINHNLSKKREGIPGYALRMPFLISFIFTFIIRRFNVGKKLAMLNFLSVKSAPMVCIISSEEETPYVWARIGRLAQNIMLSCRNCGLNTSIFVASIEMGDLKQKVKDVINSNKTPQFFFCIGYMPGQHKHTPRISTNEKIIQSKNMIEKIDKPKFYKSENGIPIKSHRVDYFDEAIKELFFIEHPTIKKEMPEAKNKLDDYLKNNKIKPIWIYYPWKDVTIKTVPDEIYFKLRTARNKNIITEEEQKNYRNSSIGIIGMSIGSDTLSSIVYTGGPKNIRIADFDTVEISNLNRMHANLLDVKKNKTVIAAQKSWEIDPFAEIDPWMEIIDKKNIEEYILKKPEINILVDAMDTLDIKILSRLICRENKIPVIMATSNGDSVIIDVERFDIEKNLQLFHGLVGDIKVDDVKSLSARENYKNWLKLATKIVGPEFLTERMQESVSVIGKNIAGVPQLGTTVNIAGSAVSYVIRRILNNQEMPSGRYVVSLEEKFIPNYNDASSVEKRLDKTKIFKNKFKSI